MKKFFVLFFAFVNTFLVMGNFANAKETDEDKTNTKISDSCKVKKNVMTDTLSMSDVIELSMCNNPITRTAWLQTKVASTYRKANFARYLPHVDIEAGIAKSEAKDFSIPGSVRKISNNGANLGVSAGWLLYDFGGREAIMSKTYETLNAAEFKYNAVLQSAVYDAIVAYYTLLASKEELLAFKLQQATNKTALEAAEKKFELGMTSRADTLQIETSYAASTLDVEKAQQSVYVNNAKLAKLIGISPSIQLNIEEKKETAKDDKNENNLDELIKQALKTRPDLLAKIASTKASYASVRAASSKFLPTISAYANKSWNDNNFSKLNSIQRDRENFAIGVKVSLPIFTGFEDTYSLRNAKYQYVAEKQELEGMKQEVELSVVNAYYSYNTSLKSLAIANKLYESALENQKVATGSYSAGKGDIISLMQAHSKLLLARKERISAEYGLNISKVALLRAVGSLNLNNLDLLK